MQTDPKLIEQLVTDLKRKPWYARRRTRVAAWLTISALYLILGAYLCPGPPLKSLITFPFLLETAAFVVIAALAGTSAILISVPGEPVPWIIKVALGVCGLIALVAIIILDPESSMRLTDITDHAGELVICSHAILQWAILPLICGLILIRATPSLRADSASFLFCIGAGMLATAILQFDCTNRSALHVLISHVGPGVVLAVIVLMLVRWCWTWSQQVRNFKTRLPKSNGSVNSLK